MCLRPSCDNQGARGEMGDKAQVTVRTFDCSCEGDGEPWRVWKRGVARPDLVYTGPLAAGGEASATSALQVEEERAWVRVEVGGSGRFGGVRGRRGEGGSHGEGRGRGTGGGLSGSSGVC